VFYIVALRKHQLHTADLLSGLCCSSSFHRNRKGAKYPRFADQTSTRKTL